MDQVVEYMSSKRKPPSSNPRTTEKKKKKERKKKNELPWNHQWVLNLSNAFLK
jgi:hypothetical protein